MKMKTEITNFEGLENQLEELNNNISSMNTHNNYEINKKLDILIELLNPDELILISKDEMYNFLEDLNDYFEEVQRKSICEGEVRMPYGTHKVIDRLERFRKYYGEVTEENTKKKINNLLVYDGELGRTLK